MNELELKFINRTRISMVREILGLRATVKTQKDELAQLRKEKRHWEEQSIRLKGETDRNFKLAYAALTNCLSPDEEEQLLSLGRNCDG